MKVKSIIIGFLSAVLIISQAACSPKAEESSIGETSTLPVTTTIPEQSQEVNDDEVMKEFNTIVSGEDVDLKRIAAFIEENIQSVTVENAAEMILEFEELQKKCIEKLEDSFYTEPIQAKFLEEFMAGTDLNQPDKIKDDTLKELVKSTGDIGFKVEQAEGSFFPVIDYSFYKKFSDHVAADIKEYIDIMAVESDNAPMKDAGLVIGWDEVVKRSLAQERFIKNYPSSKKIEDVKALYSKYENITFSGSPNTPIFDWQTKILRDDTRTAYENAIKESLESEYLQKLKGFMELLAENGYKLTEEVEKYVK